MEQPLEIHIAKPGGRKEGPFGLDEINVALAARKYRSGDYWAWHKGLDEWVPLYDVKGIIKVSSLAVGLAKETAERPNLQEKSPGSEIPQVLAESKEDLIAEEAPASGSPAELPNPVLQHSNLEEKTEEPPANIVPSVVQSAELPAVAATAERIQGANPHLEPFQPLPTFSDTDRAELVKKQADEFVNADRAKENLAAEEPAMSSPASETRRPDLEDSSVEEGTEDPPANMAPPAFPNAEVQSSAPTRESIPRATPDPEPAEPLADHEEFELANDQTEESVNADGPKEDLGAKELPASLPSVESANSASEDSLPNLSDCDTAETEQEETETPAPVVEKAEEQQMQTTAESVSEETSKEFAGELGSDPQLNQPVELLSADEPSKVSKDEARDLVEKAETAATILARLKQSFFHGTEPANGVTSYFNARRAPLPGMADTGTPPLGEEWGMPEASHPLDFHSKAVPKVPEDCSSPGPETDPAAALLAHQFSSGMPFTALEQLFIFTTGDGRAIWSSPIMSRMLEAIIGEKMERIRQGTPRDVIFNCDLSKLLKRDGAISDSVWHAMEIREPTVVARAQKKLSRTCVRTFNVERDTVVALVLFYNIQKLENGSAALGTPSSGTTRFTLPVNAGPSGSEHPR